MVKFEFVVSDEDAENIFGCIHNSICTLNENIQDLMSRERWDEYDIAATRETIKHLKNLKQLMINSRI